jgi:hypothetical protein
MLSSASCMQVPKLGTVEEKKNYQQTRIPVLRKVT